MLKRISRKLKNYSKKKKAGIIALIVACFAVIIGFLIYLNPAPIQKIVDIITYKTLGWRQSDKDDGNKYRAETSYDGTGDADEEVYAYPFDKGDGYYVTNLECIKNEGEQFDVNYNGYSELAENFLTTIFGTGYRSISDDKDTFTNSLKDMLQVNGYYDYHTPVDDYSTMLADWITTNKLQTKVDIKTDKSLYFEDIYAYQRCEIDITSYNIEKSADTAGLFPEEIDLSKDGKYIVDIRMVYDTKNKKPTVLSIDYIGKIQN